MGFEAHRRRQPTIPCSSINWDNTSMRSDKLRRHCDARASDSHSIHAHGEPGRDATQFRRFQALRCAWLTTCHFPDEGKPIHPGVRLFARFLKDLEADGTIPGQVSGLKRNCADRMDAFFEDNLSLTRSQPNRQQVNPFLTRTNRIASWANLGYMEEVVLRDRILQSLISSSKFYDHQADALIVLFRLAGATFEAYVDSSVIDRCFELLKSHGGRGKMVLVSTPSLKG